MTGEKRQVAIFRKKEDVLLAFGRGDVNILESVLKHQDFMSADKKEILGFMAESGSDFTIIDVKSVKNNPKAFFELAFGEVQKDGLQRSA